MQDSSAVLKDCVDTVHELKYHFRNGLEICRLAGLTRVALLHNITGSADLFAATRTHVYERLLDGMASKRQEQVTGEALVTGLWRHFSQAEYKAVIELWLAARNEPELGASLQPAIARIRDLADPRLSARLFQKLGRSADGIALYRVLLEAMIGMALGRAVTPGKGGLGHEEQVLAMLSRLAGAILDEP